MTEEEINRKLADFAVPIHRRRLSLENVEWLLENLSVHNDDCGAIVSLLENFRKELVS